MFWDVFSEELLTFQTFILPTSSGAALQEEAASGLLDPEGESTTIL
jgi:hypothetical protein